MTQSNVSSFFDKYAHDFNAIYGNNNNLFNAIINQLFRRSMKLRYQKTLEGCSNIEGASVLDIGCGPGHYSIALAKMGAKAVLGIDFADGMLQVASQRAINEGVNNICQFKKVDFINQELNQKFDYVVLMGLMDYMANPQAIIKKAIELTNNRAFFSFPLDGGLLAWQRKLHYKSRCDLYLYTEAQVRELFLGLDYKNLTIERIDRDLMVIVDMQA